MVKFILKNKVHSFLNYFVYQSSCIIPFIWTYVIALLAHRLHFSLLTMELCYPTSSLHTGEELFVAVVGPFMLHVAILPLLLIRWVCQLLFASCPDVLSKLIITMGLWTVLDPLAMFIVDVVLRVSQVK